MQVDIKEFEDLEQTSYDARAPIEPEKEFFHSIYIAGQTRKNHRDIIEQAGKLQIRGVDYNLDVVHFVITNIKSVLVKTKRVGNQDLVECFSYQDGQPPWKGTSGRQCGRTSVERSADQFCSTCRTNLIVAGVYTDSKGNLIRNEETGKPQFVFLRGVGVKFAAVDSYLRDLITKTDLDPIFPSRPDFERKVVNPKRFVTVVKVGKRETKFGMKDVFELSRGAEISKANVVELLKVSKKVLPKFAEKFDWSRRWKELKEKSVQVEETQKFEENKQEEQKEQTSFSFEDIQF